MTSDKAAHSYRVEAVRSGDWWSITVPELSGVFSQAKRLDQVERSAREAIAMMLDIDEAKVGALEVDVTPPATVVELLKRLHDFVATANEAGSRSGRHQDLQTPPERWWPAAQFLSATRQIWRVAPPSAGLADRGRSQGANSNTMLALLVSRSSASR